MFSFPTGLPWCLTQPPDAPSDALVHPRQPFFAWHLRDVHFGLNLDKPGSKRRELDANLKGVRRAHTEEHTMKLTSLMFREYRGGDRDPGCRKLSVVFLGLFTASTRIAFVLSFLVRLGFNLFSVFLAVVHTCSPHYAADLLRLCAQWLGRWPLWQRLLLWTCTLYKCHRPTYVEQGCGGRSRRAHVLETPRVRSVPKASPSLGF